MPASAEAWRKASPDPSESSTKPYLLRALYHFTLPQTVGAGGSPSCGSPSCGGTLECLEESLLSPSRCGTSECLEGSPLPPSRGGTSEWLEAPSPSPSLMPCCRRCRPSPRRSTPNFV